MNSVYIATNNGDIDWLHEQPNPTDTDYGYSDFIENKDALIMGRPSFEKVMTFDISCILSSSIFFVENVNFLS
ncbi:hypothetical protein [Marinicella sp. W31]|uniref:hypothetical protein n=1 Tax=Marinicella sp. W31 TaxID=3023713 RepID=UPI0037581BEA